MAPGTPLLYEASSNGERMASTSSAVGFSCASGIATQGRLGMDRCFPLHPLGPHQELPMTGRYRYLRSRELLTTSSHAMPPNRDINSTLLLSLAGRLRWLRTSWTRRLLLFPDASQPLCLQMSSQLISLCSGELREPCSAQARRVFVRRAGQVATLYSPAMAETLSCSSDKAELDSVSNPTLGSAETALGHRPGTVWQHELPIRAFVAKLLLFLLLLLLVGIPSGSPVSALVFPLVAKNRARGFALSGLAHHPRHHIGVQKYGMEQCSIQIQPASGKVRPTAHNMASPGWLLRALLGSLVQNTSLHRPVFRFPLPVFPGEKKRPLRAGYRPGTVLLWSSRRRSVPRQPTRELELLVFKLGRHKELSTCLTHPHPKWELM